MKNTENALIPASATSYWQLFPVRSSGNWQHCCLSFRTILVSFNSAYMLQAYSNYTPLSRLCISLSLKTILRIAVTSGFRLTAYFISSMLTARPDGTGAAESFEPRQVREEATVRRLIWAPPENLSGAFLFSLWKNYRSVIMKDPTTRPRFGSAAAAPMKTQPRRSR